MMLVGYGMRQYPTKVNVLAYFERESRESSAARDDVMMAVRCTLDLSSALLLPIKTARQRSSPQLEAKIFKTDNLGL